MPERPKRAVALVLVKCKEKVKRRPKRKTAGKKSNAARAGNVS